MVRILTSYLTDKLRLHVVITPERQPVNNLAVFRGCVGTWSRMLWYRGRDEVIDLVPQPHSMFCMPRDTQALGKA